MEDSGLVVCYLNSYKRQVYANGNTEQGRQLAGANFQVIYANTVLYKFTD
jgi:hypothetical protein